MNSFYIGHMLKRLGYIFGYVKSIIKINIICLLLLLFEYAIR